MKIKISTDSTCDLHADYIAAHGVNVAPLHVVMNGESYQDGVDITPPQIFENTERCGELSKTAALSSELYREIFAQLAAENDAVIHINISAEFSASYQNACNAAKEVENVYVVDSRNLSTGHGHVVCRAVELAEAGLDAKEIYEKLNEMTSRVEASFILDRLDYMRKGGRCSAVAALGANILQLKPCIEVKNGKMGVAKKYQGSFEKCLRKYVRDRLDGRTDIDPSRIFITHSYCTEEVVALVREEVEKYMHFDEVVETTAGCTVSCHCGPNTLGILFVRKA